MNLTADRFLYGMRRLAIDPGYVSKAVKKTDHIGRFWSGCASAVKQKIRPVIHYLPGGGHRLTGLPDCQDRDEKAMDFAYNASLAAVNITKVLRKQTKMPFSIG